MVHMHGNVPFSLHSGSAFTVRSGPLHQKELKIMEISKSYRPINANDIHISTLSKLHDPTSKKTALQCTKM